MSKNYQLLYNPQLLKHIQENLMKFNVKTQNGKDLKSSAVAITIVQTRDNENVDDCYSCNSQNNEAALILTKRSFQLRNHAGRVKPKAPRWICFDGRETFRRSRLRKFATVQAGHTDEASVPGF